MIFCTEQARYPNRDQSIEVITYKDIDGFEWFISRTLHGFYLRLNSDEEKFKIPFTCLLNHENICVKNTLCFFIKDTSFNKFMAFVDVIRTGKTTEILGVIEELLENRLIKNPKLLKSETLSQEEFQADI